MAAFSTSVKIGLKDALSGPAKKVAGAVKSIGSAVRGLGAVAGKVGGSLTSLKGVVAGLAALKGAAAVKGFVDEFVAGTDALAKFSREAGFSVGAVQELRYAAERTGVGTEALDMSLRVMSKNLGLFKAGLGPIPGLLKKVSPELARQLQGVQSNEEAFDLLIGTMSAIEDPAKRAAFGATVFGDAGAKLALLANEGADGIERLKAEARSYGLISEDTAKEGEAMADAQYNLKSAINGVKIAIGSGLMPVLRPLIEKWTGWVRDNRELLAQKVGAWFEGIATAVANFDMTPVLNGLNWIRDNWEYIAAGIVAIGVAFGATPLGAFAAGLALIAANFDAISSAADRASNAVLEFTDWLGITSSPTEDMRKRAEATAKMTPAEMKASLARDNAIDEAIRRAGVAPDSAAARALRNQMAIEGSRKGTSVTQSAAPARPSWVATAMGAAGAPASPGTAAVRVEVVGPPGTRVSEQEATGLELETKLRTGNRGLSL